jgi:ABC-type branched-subunit amino acid transport system substrate-binding protein
MMMTSPSVLLSAIPLSFRVFGFMVLFLLAACGDTNAPGVTTSGQADTLATTESLQLGDDIDTDTVEAIVKRLKISQDDGDEAEDIDLFSEEAQADSLTTEGDDSSVVWTTSTEFDEAQSTFGLAPEALARETAKAQSTSEPGPEAPHPAERDPLLAADALAAAFALIRQSTDINDALIQDKDVPLIKISKPPEAIRAAMLMPLDGAAKNIGDDMRGGAEQAIFVLGNDKIDLTFHDTSQGADRAMAGAIDQKADVIIGPLFAADTAKVRSIASRQNIPVLSFSNDSAVIGKDVWLIGQTPEQEIETVLGRALKVIKPLAASGRRHLSVAIIAESNEYGVRISNRAIDILAQHDGVSSQLLTLDKAVLADEKALREAIKNLTKWLPPASDDTIKPPEFDIVLIAGGASFSLQVAPVLSWYDLDPKQVQYLGTSTWNSHIILQEPSLNGGWFAHLPPSEKFSAIWSDIHQREASPYAVMAFDAVMLVSTLDPASSAELRSSLTSDLGFSGFSGIFKFNPDGTTLRQLEIRAITPNGYEVVQQADSAF